MAFDCKVILTEIDNDEIQRIGFILESTGIVSDDETPFTRVHFNECSSQLREIFSPQFIN